MSANRSVGLLSLLDRAELTQFAKLLDSLFFTQKKFLKPLFEGLRTGLGSPETEPDAPGIFRKMFPVKKNPGKKFSQHDWHKALNDLNEQIKTFLVVQRGLKNEPAFQLELTAELASRSTDQALFSASAEKTRRLLTDQPDHSNRPLQLFELDKIEFMHPTTDRLRADPMAIDRLENSLDRHYFLSKIQLAVARLGRAPHLRLDGERSHSFETLKMAAAPFADDGQPLLQVYLKLLDLFENPQRSLEDLTDFDSFFWEKQAKIANSDAETVTRHLGNLFDFEHAKGLPGASRSSFHAFQKAKERGLFTDGRAEDSQLRIGLLMAAHGSKDEFAEFLEKLPAEFGANIRREDAVNIFRAYHEFHHNRFEECDRLTAQISTRHMLYGLRVHSIRLRSLTEIFEKEPSKTNIETLEQELKSFQSWLTRNEVFSQSWKESYVNLVGFVRLVMKMPPVSSAVLLDELKKRPAACGDWAVRKAHGRDEKLRHLPSPLAITGQ